jgi:hypothetical protein
MIGAPASSMASRLPAPTRIWLLPLSIVGGVGLTLFVLTYLIDAASSADPAHVLQLLTRPNPAAAANTLANAGEIVAAVLAIALNELGDAAAVLCVVRITEPVRPPAARPPQLHELAGLRGGHAHGRAPRDTRYGGRVPQTQSRSWHSPGGHPAPLQRLMHAPQSQSPSARQGFAMQPRPALPSSQTRFVAHAAPPPSRQWTA